MSMRDKRMSASGRASRRHSVGAHGLASPPPDGMPEIPSKAAKVLGVEKSSSKKKSRTKCPSPEDDDIVVVGAVDADAEADADGAPKRVRRSKRSHDDDMVIVDGGGPSETPFKRGASAPRNLAWRASSVDS